MPNGKAVAAPEAGTVPRVLLFCLPTLAWLPAQELTHLWGPLGLQLQVELLQSRHLLQNQAKVLQVAKPLSWEAGPGSGHHSHSLGDIVK